ncbi:metallophosphoesterase family protein [Candidatus Sulfidibacterium hydrothermale]|uniref:purple acid phosphatase family protein n=1 Tax=Candidatus Sulfidibacterium hydrothermale TaxID=2875962 RepID=UPI001F0B3C4D|nr:metallophosphoesterase family protein [Candidatus Sulfidibacterium hydrothermale]UBM62338.1 metallophosphoesterase family protein [Candidatus Sulfidibacterium hydrothermale]
MKRLFYLTVLALLSVSAMAQSNAPKIPFSYTNIVAHNGKLYFKNPKTGEEYPQKTVSPFEQIQNLAAIPQGTKDGVVFDFHNDLFNGTLYYGLFSSLPQKYAYPVYFKRAAPIREGRARVNLKELAGRYDIANWEKTGHMKLGYRVVNDKGVILYDGRINIRGKGPFTPDLTITQGPFVNELTSDGAVISFETNEACQPVVKVDGKSFTNPEEKGTHHEIQIKGLEPGKKYNYTVDYGDYSETYYFKTAPKEGSRTAFTFAYASDSRKSNGGGERDVYGVNAYVVKRMAVLAAKENAVFMQFTGDLINGYSSCLGQQKLEYANWKITAEPYWHYMPFVIAPGNHEAFLKIFDNGSHYGIAVDNFPFDKVSAEKVFADEFVNPQNGPSSEDGAYYDPNKKTTDFPPYKETAYYYIYDNIAMVALNANYWYTPNHRQIPISGGNVHAYIMDNQLKWLKNTLAKLQKDPNIDYVFVTIHTPAFPNAGHSGDDMWYHGNNKIRPWVAGKPVKKGIIERRDQFLNILVNENSKVLALLCGDEHNYTRMLINNNTPRYPKGYDKPEVKLKRSIWQITNGSAGAPYYGQEKLPWSSFVKEYTTQHALMLFDVHGKKVTLRVINPDTFEKIEQVDLTPNVH